MRKFLDYARTSLDTFQAGTRKGRSLKARKAKGARTAVCKQCKTRFKKGRALGRLKWRMRFCSKACDLAFGEGRKKGAAERVAVFLAKGGKPVL